MMHLMHLYRLLQWHHELFSFFFFFLSQILYHGFFSSMNGDQVTCTTINWSQIRLIRSYLPTQSDLYVPGKHFFGYEEQERDEMHF